MDSDFDKNDEEAHTHPLVENLDDVGEYIFYVMLKEGILALPHPIRGYCHESSGIRENHNWLVEEIFMSQTCCRNFGPAGGAATDASPKPCSTHLLQYVTVRTCSHSSAAENSTWHK